MMNPRTWAVVTCAMATLLLLSLLFVPVAAFDLACATLTAGATLGWVTYVAEVDKELRRER